MAEKTDAQKRAQKNYMEKFSIARVRMDKGDYELLQAHATAQGESVNGFIKRAISETIARDGAEKPAGAPERSAAVPISSASSNAAQAVSAPVIAVPPDKLNRAKAHAEARREPLSGFLVRAIDETMERDRSTPAASQGDSEGEST